MWGNNFNSRNTITTVIQKCDYKPNDLVIDWGCGCGHQSTFFSEILGMNMLGVDINYPAIEFAKKYSSGKFYCTDGIDLSWIPDNYFNHFFSFASTYYVPTEKWELFVIQAIRIIKPTGSIMLGWLNGIYGRPYGKLDKSIFNFLKNIINITYEIIDDRVLYENSNDLISYCESYSIFIIKLK
jgi:ubiquinone/menaquinone biosynthesis C-methylase UbiE